jgi:PqqD family protein of HPr-rel-A system
LTLREFDDELVVRNAMTGSTHLLQPLAAEALALLMEAGDGMTAAELADRLGDEAAGGIAAMESLLQEFKRLGLAEPCD